jgi:hypothetical protein
MLQVSLVELIPLSSLLPCPPLSHSSMTYDIVVLAHAVMHVAPTTAEETAVDAETASPV